MTTQDHNPGERVIATYPNGDAARRATLAIEQLGIESSRVHVRSESRLTDRAAESRVDAAAVERPRRQAVQGIIVGGIAGVLMGLVVGLVFEVIPLGIALALFAIPGVVLGALFGVYTRLQTNTEITDADADGFVELTLDLTALDAEDRRAAVEKLRSEQPIRLVEA